VHDSGCQRLPSLLAAVCASPEAYRSGQRPAVA